MCFGAPQPLIFPLPRVCAGAATPRKSISGLSLYVNGWSVVVAVQVFVIVVVDVQNCCG
jgi:hypothetical protein